MKPKFLIGLMIGLLLVVVAFQWDGADEQQPQAQTVAAEQQAPLQEGQTVEEFLQKYREVKNSHSVRAADTADEIEPNDALISPEDEPVSTGIAEHEVNIGPLIHPELDDPNLGQLPSEPMEIGELVDPETYLPPAPDNEKEINIGPLLPPPGEEPVDDSDTEQPVEVGQSIDAAAEPVAGGAEPEIY